MTKQEFFACAELIHSARKLVNLALLECYSDADLEQVKKYAHELAVLLCKYGCVSRRRGVTVEEISFENEE